MAQHRTSSKRLPPSKTLEQFIRRTEENKQELALMYDMHRFVQMVKLSLRQAIRLHSSEPQQSKQLLGLQVKRISTAIELVERQQSGSGVPKNYLEELEELQALVQTIRKVQADQVLSRKMAKRAKGRLSGLDNKGSQSIRKQISNSSKRVRQVKSGVPLVRTLSRQAVGSSSKYRELAKQAKPQFKQSLISLIDSADPSFKAKEDNLVDYFRARFENQSKFLCEDLLAKVLTNPRRTVSRREAQSEMLETRPEEEEEEPSTVFLTDNRRKQHSTTVNAVQTVNLKSTPQKPRGRELSLGRLSTGVRSSPFRTVRSAVVKRGPSCFKLHPFQVRGEPEDKRDLVREYEQRKESALSERQAASFEQQRQKQRSIRMMFQNLF